MTCSGWIVVRQWLLSNQWRNFIYYLLQPQHCGWFKVFVLCGEINYCISYCFFFYSILLQFCYWKDNKTYLKNAIFKSVYVTLWSLEYLRHMGHNGLLYLFWKNCEEFFSIIVFSKWFFRFNIIFHCLYISAICFSCFEVLSIFNKYIYSTQRLGQHARRKWKKERTIIL